MYSTYNLSSHKDHPQQVVFMKRSGFRDAISNGYEWFGSTVTRHKLCCGTVVGWSLMNKLVGWAWKAEKEIYRMDITREQLDALRDDPTGWWPGDPIEDDEEE